MFEELKHLILANPIHRMQTWRTTQSAPGTSSIKARLVGPLRFILTVLLHFTMPTGFLISECHQKGVKSSTREKICFSVSLVASDGKTDEGK